MYIYHTWLCSSNTTYKVVNYRRWGIKYLHVLLIITVLFVCLAARVYAIAPPDIGPTILSASMYKHALQSNDRYLIGKYLIDYTTNPSDPISVTFLARLVTTSGDEVGVTTIYPYKDLGYNRGVFAMWWAADDPNIPDWNSGNYTLRIDANPTANWTSTPTPATLNSASFVWEASLTVGATSAIVGPDIEAVAAELGDYWNVSLLTPVSTGGVNGNVFTSSGEAYFSNAIPGLRTIAPALFSISSVPAVYDDSISPQTRATNLTARRASLGLYEGTVWGVSTDVIYTLLAVVASIVLAGITAAILAPLGGAVSMVGGGAMGVATSIGFVPILFVYIGLLSAVAMGFVAFVGAIAIGLWMASHVSRVL